VEWLAKKYLNVWGFYCGTSEATWVWEYETRTEQRGSGEYDSRSKAIIAAVEWLYNKEHQYEIPKHTNQD